MQLLERLDHYSLARGRAVTLPLLRTMLAELDDVTDSTPAQTLQLQPDLET
jgi:chromosomal replication initiation ATPase DnaA